MKKTLLAIIFSPFLIFAQEIPKLTDEMAMKLSEKPLHCINQEYPNKTAHIINNENEVDILDVYNAIKNSKRIYPDSIVKELISFREKFGDFCKEQNISLPIVTIDEVKGEGDIY